MIHMQNHECDLALCPWHERDRFIADIAAMRIWMERTDDCICCGDDSLIDRLIRRARALEGKA